MFFNMNGVSEHDLVDNLNPASTTSPGHHELFDINTDFDEKLQLEWIIGMTGYAS
ncbi:predicted protein [Botrytis cinerea T4]|uniref:Uncharacterized protein n=1 Tax=Botryotinia fuckeliana (strain T4) TaxID=999810 RepID=G2Y8A4_BOTF4|nr:predicted protein [Botrytis cinerea T4]